MKVVKNGKSIRLTLKERKKYPKNYFLDPINRKYPYRYKTGSISCKALKSAITLANMHKDKKVKERAERLYKRYCK